VIEIPFEGFTGEYIRAHEQREIQVFLARHHKLFSGNVLDYGCGRPGTCREPEHYREMVEEFGGGYTGYDLGEPEPACGFNTVLCIQVVQYVENVEGMFAEIDGFLLPGGHLVMVYPAAWPCSEAADRWRFTRTGMYQLTASFGFEVIAHPELVVLGISGFRLPLVHGMVARKMTGLKGDGNGNGN
jgi:hypothetical protein